jgi:hypothetical protein
MNYITNSIWLNLSAQKLHRAAALTGKIKSLENQLISLLGAPETTKNSAPKKRRKMSASARAKIAKSARARWKKAKAAGKKSL